MSFKDTQLYKDAMGGAKCAQCKRPIAVSPQNNNANNYCPECIAAVHPGAQVKGPPVTVRSAEWAWEWVRLSKESFVRMDCAHEAECLDQAIAAIQRQALSVIEERIRHKAEHYRAMAEKQRQEGRNVASSWYIWASNEIVDLLALDTTYDPFGPEDQIPDRVDPLALRLNAQHVQAQVERDAHRYFEKVGEFSSDPQSFTEERIDELYERWRSARVGLEFATHKDIWRAAAQSIVQIVEDSAKFDGEGLAALMTTVPTPSDESPAEEPAQ